MSKIYTSAHQLIGNTPMLELCNIEKNHNLNAKIFAKMECFNPGGSIKDRVALKMLDDAQKNGMLTPNSVIIEPTSGNTGIGIAAVAAMRGLKSIIVMPDTMSIERRKIVKAYGAELVLSEGKLGMSGAIKKAQELKNKIPDSIIAGQFENPSNPDAHYYSTGPEIYNDTDGKVDILISSVGTGGTISGTGKYLKEKISNIKIVAVEPKSSAVLSGKCAGTHKIQGIGAGFVPKVLDTKIYDDIFTVTDDDAINTAREFAFSEGILVGISSGAALYAAIQYAKNEQNNGKNIVVILPDTGNRYLSTELFE